jgi:hypothetical protein
VEYKRTQPVDAGNFYKKAYTEDVVGDMTDRGFSENLSNAFAWQYSPLVRSIQEFAYFGDDRPDPNYNVWDDIEGFETYKSSFVNAKSKEHTQFIKDSIRKSEKVRADLANTSWYYPSQLVAGILDPLNIAFALPVAGQLGLLAKGGMTARQAFAAGAKGGLAAGAAGELVRAPFDPVATKQETLGVLTASTILGGVIGSVPSVYRNARPEIEKSVTKMKETLTDRGSWVNNMYEDISLKFTKREADAVTPDGEELAPAIKVNTKENSFEINEDTVQMEYDTKAWSSPLVPEHIRLKPEEFQSKTEYQDFLIHREKVKKELKREVGQSVESYEANVYKQALERTHSNYGQKKTVFSDSVWFKGVTTPGKRILFNDKVSDRIKRYYELINGNAAMAIDRNIAGRGVQSIIQRQPVHFMHGERLRMQLEKLYEEEISSGVWNAFGLNFNNIQSMATNKISYDEWFKIKADEYIKLGERWDRVDRYDNISDTDKKTFELFRKFFERYDEEGTSLNLWRAQKTIDEDLTRINADIERKQSIIDGISAQVEGKGKKVGATQKQMRLKENLERQIARHKEDVEYLTAMKANGLDRKKFYFPIYYDKRLLQDAAQRERFTNIIEEHVRQNPKPFVWDSKANKMVERNPSITDREIAEGIVRTILEESDVERLGVSGIGSKHTRMRTLDIPEWKVKDFILKDIGIIDAYTRKMGNKIEWTRKFGKRTIDDVLDEIEEISVSEGKLTEKEIAQLKRDFVADYEYSLGIHMREPDRWDAQAVRAIKEIAGMTYLHKAGIASVTDAGAIAFEHGLGNAFGPLITQRGREAVQLAKAEASYVVKGTNYMLSMARDRMFADSVSRVQPNATERFLNPITNVFYNIPIIGNNLGVVTRYGRIADSVLRQSKLVKMAQDIAANKRGADIEYWARYGLDIDDAKKIASYADKFVVEDGFVFANRMEWPSTTPAEKELLLKWDTAMNAGTGNTIIMATAKDKPIISRGIVYMPWHPWMKDVPFFSGLKPDPQVSTANFKYARIESGMMTFPFQFMDFTLAATSRITSQMFDPARHNRLLGAASLFGLGYLALELKKEDWWFENKGTGEIIARSFDHSGLAGIYSDIGYMGLHMAMGFGAINEDNDWLRGKYRPSATDAWLEPFGAGPGLLVDWTKAIADLMDGNPSEDAERIKYLLPFNHLTSMAYDFITKD